MRGEVVRILATEGYGAVNVDALTDRRVTEIDLIGQRGEIGGARRLIGSVLRDG